MRCNDDVRREEFHLHEVRLVQAAGINGTTGDDGGCAESAARESFRDRKAARHAQYAAEAMQFPRFRYVRTEFAFQTADVAARQRST